MGIQVEEGRDFLQADELSEEAVYIFNHTAQMSADMEVGDRVTSWLAGRIVGLTGDVKFTSLRNGENNIAFVTGNMPIPLTVSYIRLKAGTDILGAVSHIRETMADMDPSYPYDIEFAQSDYGFQYIGDYHITCRGIRFGRI